MEVATQYFQSTQDYEIAAFLLLVFVFELWEHSRPARRIDRFADLRLDLLSFGFALLVNRGCNRAINGTMDALLPEVALNSLHAMAALPTTVKILGSLVLADFTIYWLHRAQHKYDVLWRTHAWHHSVERLYWFSGFRTSLGHSLMNNIPQAAIPLFLFQMTPIEAGIAYSIGLLIQFWEHTNVKVNLGPLAYVFITPDYHRVHHSANELCRTNFGGTFSLWDRAFGTYTDPKTVPEDTPLGLGEQIQPRKIPRMLLGV
ncbi:MAG: sterol desaturase family protein [Planctomycetes bacterium]|nr:sterol desaturase family protein [Planctomycetota bacterium]